MRPWLRFLPVFLLVTLFSIASAQDLPVFRIGVLDEIDGPITNGARLAIALVNDEGGVRGADGTLFRLELVIQPAADGDPFENALATLRDSGIIAVLGPDDSDLVLNNLPALQALNLPVLITATGDTLLASDRSGRLFRARAAEVHQGRALADYFVNQMQIRRIAGVQIGTDINVQAGLIGFTTAATSLGVNVQPIITVDPTASLTPFIDQLVTAVPDGLVVYGDPAIAARLYTALRNANWTGMFAFNGATEAVFKEAVPSVQLPGIFSTTTWPYTAPDEASDNFRDEC